MAEISLKPTAAPSGGRSVSRRRLLSVGLSGIGLVLGLVVWHVSGSAEPVLLSTPLGSAETLIRLIETGELVEALAESGLIFVLGLFASIVVGVGVGVLLARSSMLYGATGWLVFALQAVPIIAVAPLIVLAVGFDTGAQVLVVFLSAVFPILVPTMEGARQVPPSLVDVTKIFRSREWRVWRDLLLPHTVPYAMTGVRQGIAMALVGTLVAEFFLKVNGLGGLILAASANFDTSTVLGLTILIAVIAVVLMNVVSLVERRFATWKEVGEQ